MRKRFAGIVGVDGDCFLTGLGKNIATRNNKQAKTDGQRKASHGNLRPF
jgi:hypothetical protein